MNASAAIQWPVKRLWKNLSLMLARPPRIQLAALCHRQGENGAEVLLITSRNTRRLIIPKGWPMQNHSARHTAKREAFEEAGIIGKVGKQPIGEYQSHKGLANGLKVRTNVIVYPMSVERIESDYPEFGQRERLWLPLDQAIERCQDIGLQNLLASPSVKSLLTKV